MAINGRAGTVSRSTDGNHTAGLVRCIGGLAGPDAGLELPHLSKELPPVELKRAVIDQANPVPLEMAQDDLIACDGDAGSHIGATPFTAAADEEDGAPRPTLQDLLIEDRQWRMRVDEAPRDRVVAKSLPGCRNLDCLIDERA